ncbi:MAG: hypothetical protein K1X89_19295 [Myxococcaceae bacterium]|nr:hypothetical protein [Myxococcaceae bacterium]
MSTPKPFFRRTWVQVVVVVLLLLVGAVVGLGASLPKPIGRPIVLQPELLSAPAKPFPVERRFLQMSATELAAAIKAKQATSVEVVTAYLNHIKNENHRYAALIYLREAEALADARAADEAVARGEDRPLLGVPVTIKEMYWVKGSPTTLNAKMYGVTATEDAPTVAALKSAGAVVLGTTNVPFMLGDYQTKGEVYPTANNPFDVARTPGGSTGGGAAALAAGFSALELGSDMGGSIRVPAAFNGLWALKATFGTLNISQGTSPDPSQTFHRLAMVSPGPLARAPEDLELMWRVLKDAPADPRFQKPVTWAAPSSKGLDGYRFGWVDEWASKSGPVPVGAQTKAKLAELMGKLEAAGAKVDRSAPEVLDDGVRLFLASFAQMMAEGQGWPMRKLLQLSMQPMSDGSPVFAAFDEAVLDPSDERWTRTQAEREQLIKTWSTYFEAHDFLVSPVVYGPAFKHCETGATIVTDDGAKVPYIRYVVWAPMINAVGLPTLSVPLGLDSHGLPIGVQVIGPPGSDPELLHLAVLLKPLTPGFVPPKP